MALGRSETEARVALIRHKDETAALGGNEISPRQADIRFEILMAEKMSRAPRDRLGIVVVGTEAVFLKRRRDLTTVLVDDRFDDVRRMVAVDLHDEFAQVGLECLHPVLLQKMREFGLFADHRFGLHHLRRPAGSHDAEHRLVGGLGSRGPVHDHAVSLQLRFNLREVGIEIFNDVLLHFSGDAAEAVRIGVFVEEQLGALLVPFFRTVIHRRTGVGLELGGKLIDLLESHRRSKSVSRS